MSAKFPCLSGNPSSLVKTTNPDAPEEETCGLLSLPTELKRDILGLCGQGDQAVLARTCKALTPVSRITLFCHVKLPFWNDGLSFRQNCKQDVTLKSKIRSLEFPCTDDWVHWLRSTFSNAGMPLLASMEVNGLAHTNSNSWDLFTLASETSPFIYALTLAEIRPSIPASFPDAPLPALRELYLLGCKVNEHILRALARDLPVLDYLGIEMPKGDSISWGSIAALASFRQLTALELGGPRLLDALKAPGPGELCKFEFPLLNSFYIGPALGVKEWEFLKHLWLPKLEFLGVVISQRNCNLADAATCLTSSARLPILSVIHFTQYAERMRLAPRFKNPIPLRMDTLFSRLRKQGFRFKLSDNSGIERKEKYWMWKAARGDPELIRRGRRKGFLF